ncbi:putative ATP-dependent RNA helicase TDRD12-like protein [Dinothrombium tinctorium]|uniref:RNA helicase n=1 Tax=Dinothrombium tinctorium TaxID=1965070 RepID=A0A3S3P802_9ACAR|nr:putative ATP-dependent RNA helicase TDRD12-like protein [Dinothrombium tinctorium]RWS09869.1 putative ATP-dependent RNA helicase TDRD12-like protein [Dinothrombium tinctorium]RWS14698.1 putative ATP-dependent RNA helicase TDRD12-like protein [Dinothrombium tinctorium]
MIFAEKWTKEVETFKETQYRPVVVFGNYFEASIANNVNNRVIFVSDESNRGDELLKLLNSLKDIMKNIAVVCRNHCEAIEILQLLSRINIRVYVIDEKTESFKYLSIINQWSNYHSVLIITDQILKSCNRIISKINSTHCLVHYNLPQTKGDFNTRYQLISETIRSPELRKMCTTYIILGPENKLQFFQIYKCLRRIKQEISGEMKAFKKSISRKLCQNYLSFGYCPLKKYFCVLRHSFEASEKANENLPTDGQIKGLITHVVSANEFYMVIEEHRNADHQWQKVDKIATLQQIKQSMETLKKRRNSVKNVIIDEIYAIVVTEKNVVENNVNGNHKNVRNCKSQIQMIINEAFHRVKVLELVENGNKENNVIVKILHIDLGYVTHCKLSDLIELPLHLKQIAPLAHKMYLWGVKPLDNELEWHEKITNIFKKIVMAQNIAYITAWIRLQLNGVFWVDSMKIVTKLKALKVEALSCKPAEVLIEKKFAENNNRQLPNFNNDRERILQKWKCDAQKSLIQNAHLEDTTMVYLSFFKTLHEFYVRNVSFQPCLADLEADISNSITKLVKVKYFFIGLICIVFYEKDNIYNRVRIVDINEDEQIDVYFVDHGETLKVSKDCCFQIDEKFITRLPFQAIKCKLNGIVGNVEPDVVFDYTRLENESFKLILAKKISKENDTNIVRLYVEDEEFEENIRFSLLSKWLFQNKFVEYTSSEEANAEPFMFLAKEEEEEIEEENSMIQLFDFEEFAKSLMKAEENDVKRTPKVESRRKQLMRALQKVQKKKEKVEMEEKEESDEGSPTVMINVPYAPGDFDYEYVQDILPYDPADLDTDEESEHEIFDFDPDYELNSELDMILNNAPKV